MTVTSLKRTLCQFNSELNQKHLFSFICIMWTQTVLAVC